MREPVASSAVAEIGYDPATLTLEVAFPPSRKTGESALWSYAPVRPDVYEEIRTAPSIGIAFGRLIKGNPAIVASRLPNVVLETREATR